MEYKQSQNAFSVEKTSNSVEKLGENVEKILGNVEKMHSKKFSTSLNVLIVSTAVEM